MLQHAFQFTYAYVVVRTLYTEHLPPGNSKQQIPQNNAWSGGQISILAQHSLTPSLARSLPDPLPPVPATTVVRRCAVDPQPCRGRPPRRPDGLRDQPPRRRGRVRVRARVGGGGAAGHPRRHGRPARGSAAPGPAVGRGGRGGDGGGRGAGAHRDGGAEQGPQVPHQEGPAGADRAQGGRVSFCRLIACPVVCRLFSLPFSVCVSLYLAALAFEAGWLSVAPTDCCHRSLPLPSAATRLHGGENDSPLFRNPSTSRPIRKRTLRTVDLT